MPGEFSHWLCRRLKRHLSSPSFDITSSPRSFGKHFFSIEIHFKDQESWLEDKWTLESIRHINSAYLIKWPEPHWMERAKEKREGFDLKSISWSKNARHRMGLCRWYRLAGANRLTFKQPLWVDIQHRFSSSVVRSLWKKVQKGYLDTVLGPLLSLFSLYTSLLHPLYKRRNQ